MAASGVAPRETMCVASHGGKTPAGQAGAGSSTAALPRHEPDAAQTLSGDAMAHAKKTLQALGVLPSIPRIAVLATLQEATGSMTVAEVHEVVQRHRHLPWLTVDKTLRFLVTAGLLREVATPGVRLATARGFQYAGPGQPSGLRALVVCPVCGRTERIASPYIGRLLGDIQRWHGRRAQGAQLQIVAACHSCA